MKFITILEHNNVYKYYFNQTNNLNEISFYKRNMKQTVRSGSMLSGLYSKSYERCQPLNHYIYFSSNTYFTKFRLNSIRSNFQKLRNSKNN